MRYIRDTSGHLSYFDGLDLAGISAAAADVTGNFLVMSRHEHQRQRRPEPISSLTPANRKLLFLLVRTFLLCVLLLADVVDSAVSVDISWAVAS